jgi:hypothetical protein
MAQSQHAETRINYVNKAKRDAYDARGALSRQARRHTTNSRNFGTLTYDPFLATITDLRPSQAQTPPRATDSIGHVRQRTPRGRNCTLIRDPMACDVFGTACSQVRWQLPPITSRSPCPTS